MQVNTGLEGLLTVDQANVNAILGRRIALRYCRTDFPFDLLALLCGFVPDVIGAVGPLSACRHQREPPTCLTAHMHLTCTKHAHALDPSMHAIDRTALGTRF